MADLPKSVRERITAYIQDDVNDAWSGLFEDDVVTPEEEAQARAVMDEIVAAVKEVGTRPPNYDPDFGDDKICVCGHTYYRHFDSYENMSPVGCKYCECDKFKDQATGALAPEGPARKPTWEDDDGGAVPGDDG